MAMDNSGPSPEQRETRATGTSFAAPDFSHYGEFMDREVDPFDPQPAFEHQQLYLNPFLAVMAAELWGNGVSSQVWRTVMTRMEPDGRGAYYQAIDCLKVMLVSDLTAIVEQDTPQVTRTVSLLLYDPEQRVPPVREPLVKTFLGPCVWNSDNVGPRPTMPDYAHLLRPVKRLFRRQETVLEGIGWRMTEDQAPGERDLELAPDTDLYYEPEALARIQLGAANFFLPRDLDPAEIVGDVLL